MENLSRRVMERTILALNDGLKFPGEVTICGNADAKVHVNVMHRSGNA